MWILIVIFFMGSQPIDSKILTAPSEVECKKGRESLPALAEVKGWDIWMGECVEVKHSLLKKDRDS